MKHIKDVLKDAVPQRWTAVDLAVSINLDRNSKRTVRVTSVSNMLKHAVAAGEISVHRSLKDERLHVEYHGPAAAFNRIRERVNTGQ